MIKLFKIGELENGTERFQTQLELFHTPSECRGIAASFIRKDGIMKVWQYGQHGGCGFYPYHGQFEIVQDIEDMKRQPL
jgi:hypothetical protein